MALTAPSLAQLVRVGSIWLLPFQPSQLHLGVLKVPGSARMAVPQTALGALQQSPGALAVVDGPMFDICDGQPDAYASYQCGLLLYRYLDKSRGIDAPSQRTDRGVTISVMGDRAFALPRDQVVPGASVAVQLYPPLLLNGQVVTNPDLNQTAEWRTGLVVLSDGRLAFVAGAMALDPFARALRAAGAVHGGYLDGGGSGKMVLADGTRIGASEDRRVPSWLVVMPVAGTGTGTLVVGGLLAVGAVAVGAAIVVAKGSATATRMRRR